jgi:hypothetical protein
MMETMRGEWTKMAEERNKLLRFAAYVLKTDKEK